VRELTALADACVTEESSQGGAKCSCVQLRGEGVTIPAYSLVQGPAAGGNRTSEPTFERKLRTNRRFTFGVNRL
jgi:hypothetical protein